MAGRSETEYALRQKKNIEKCITARKTIVEIKGNTGAITREVSCKASRGPLA